MRKFILFFLAVIFVVTNLFSAEVTDVASSFDYENPFDFNLDVYYNNSYEFMSLKREYNNMQNAPYADGSGNYYTTEGRRVETEEYSGNSSVYYQRELDMTAEFGLYHDLSLSFNLPIILTRDYSLDLKSVGTDGNPLNDSLAGQGFFPYSKSLNYTHKGVGDLSVGLQWAPYNQARHQDAFSWLLGFKVTFPSSNVATPKGMNTYDTTTHHSTMTGKTGDVGGGQFLLEFRSAVAKRYEVSEPYFQFAFTLPVNASKSIVQDVRYQYKINTGAEFITWDDKDNHRKIAIRTDIEMLYSSKGNNYNNIADARWAYDDVDVVKDLKWNLPANKDKYYNILPMEDAFMQFSFMLKPIFRVAKYVSFGGYAKVGYRQKHYLTNAKEDFKNGNNEPGFISGLDSEGEKRDGGRLLDEAHILFGWGAFLTLNF